MMLAGGAVPSREGVMTFAEKLRELREAAGLTEFQVADLAGVPRGTVHDYAVGRRLPSLVNACRIARALGVTCHAFAFCDDVLGEATPPRPGRKPRGKKGE
jgi:transcriptional regulator with XRE-family HTH domain